MYNNSLKNESNQKKFIIKDKISNTLIPKVSKNIHNKIINKNLINSNTCSNQYHQKIQLNPNLIKKIGPNIDKRHKNILKLNYSQSKSLKNLKDETHLKFRNSKNIKNDLFSTNSTSSFLNIKDNIKEYSKPIKITNNISLFYKNKPNRVRLSESYKSIELSSNIMNKNIIRKNLSIGISDNNTTSSFNKKKGRTNLSKTKFNLSLNNLSLFNNSNTFSLNKNVFKKKKKNKINIMFRNMYMNSLPNLLYFNNDKQKKNSKNNKKFKNRNSINYHTFNNTLFYDKYNSINDKSEGEKNIKMDYNKSLKNIHIKISTLLDDLLNIYLKAKNKNKINLEYKK